MPNIRDGNECMQRRETEAVIQTKLNGVPEYSSVDTYCIYRVPKLLRQTNEEAYTPTLIPIGPYHKFHNHPKSEAFKTVEGLKLNYLKSFLAKNPEVTLLDYINIVTYHKDNIHWCYAPRPTSSDHDNDSSDFIEMVLTDSAFLIELFRKGSQDIADDDMIWRNPSLKHEVLRDILLMENQLPLFVLRDLLNKQRVNDGGIAVLVPAFLENNYGITLNPQLIDLLQVEQLEIPHLLDLVRRHYVAGLNPSVTDPAEAGHNSPAADPALQPQQNNRQIKVFPKATKLVNANVKFQVGDSLVFNSHEGTLTLPKLAVRHQTECLYRNLIAYERCNHPNEPYFISYIYFMNCLIDTPKDIQVLVKKGVIESLWRSKDLSQMLNSLCKNVDISKDAYLYTLQTELIEKYYGMTCNHYIAYLYREYSTPWTICSLVGAIWLLVATTLQTWLDLSKGK